MCYLAMTYYNEVYEPRLQKQASTPQVKLAMYFALAIGACAAAKLTNEVLGRPYTKPPKRRAK